MTAHEAGHALQRLLNPVSGKGAELRGAIVEAQAFSFAGALIRKIGTRSTAEWPRDDWARFAVGHWRQAFEDSLNDTTVHDRGRFIMWLAVLHDPELVELKEELRPDTVRRVAGRYIADWSH